MNILDQSNDQFELDPAKNYLEELVGEDKKFKDLEALAKGKATSDHYISTLERSLDELREDYKKLDADYKAGQKVQELLDRLELEKNPHSRDNTHNSNEDNRMPAIDMNEIESLVSNKIEQRERTRTETANYDLVQNKVKEHFGDNFKTVLKQKATALGLTDDYVNQIARTNPSLFFKTFDVGTNQGEGFQTPPRSETRNSSFAPQNGNLKRNYSYYQKMRKENPVMYNDPKIRVQMDKDAQALGMEFFNA